jgi:hypothetical protein
VTGGMWMMQSKRPEINTGPKYPFFMGFPRLFHEQGF